MAEIPTHYGIILAAILFGLGIAGILIHRNIFFILIFVEVMLNAAGLAFVVAAARWGQADGQVMFIFILATAAAEVAIGLGLLLRLHYQFKTLNVDQASDLRG